MLYPSHILHFSQMEGVTLTGTYGYVSNTVSHAREWLRSELSRSKLFRKIPLRYIEVVVALIGGINTYLILAYREEIVSFLEHSFLVLIEKVCIIAGIAGILIYTKFFQGILDKKFTIRNRLLAIFTFGSISIFGTYSGLELYGAIVNVRDLAPMVAGLTGGPIIGTCAGLIGALHRYSLGGSTAFPCSLATILAGFLGGMVYVGCGRRFIGTTGAVTVAILMEIIHLTMALLLTSPYSYAIVIVRAVALPVTLSNAFGMLVFALIISNYIKKSEHAKTIFEDSDDAEMHEYQMQAAGRIQHTFLTDDVPAVNGLDIAACRIPGKTGIVDFYDFMTVSRDRLAITVVDIPGNTFKGSVEMAILYTILRNKGAISNDAESVVQYLNARFMNDEHADHIKLFYGIIDTKTKIFTYMNAGIAPPVLLANGKPLKLRTDAVLGSLEKKVIRNNELALNRGDVLFIHTDGMERGGLMQAWDRIMTSLIHENKTESAEGILSKIKVALPSHGPGEAGFDDMVLVVVKVL
jgi:phosphoserine phosphatase RsbU/P